MKKEYNISAIRGIAMGCIILCHVMQYLGCELAWWFNVGVQIFLCMSGFLYGRKEIENGKFLKNGFRKILDSYYIVLIPFALIGRFVTNTATVTNIKNALLLRSTIMGGEHLWFVPTILFCYCITVFLTLIFKAEDRERTRFAKLLVTLVFTFTILRQFIPFFNAAWISCYIIGFYLARVRGERAYRKVSILLVTIAILGNSLKILFVYILKKSIPFEHYIYDYTHAYLGIALFILLRYVLRNVKENRLLHFTDTYSYEIYLVHQFYILGPLTLMELSASTFCNILIIFGSVLLSAIILKKLTKFANQGIDRMARMLRGKN